MIIVDNVLFWIIFFQGKKKANRLVGFEYKSLFFSHFPADKSPDDDVFA